MPLAPLLPKVAAQTLLGAWGYQELQLNSIPTQRMRIIVRTEPRLHERTWDRFMAMGYLGYSPCTKHTFLLGAVSAHFCTPRRFYQERLQQRWQFRLGFPFLGALTLEERWQSYRYVETRLRLSLRYDKRWATLRLTGMTEVHFQDKGRLLQGPVALREQRIGLFLGLQHSKKWDFEIGYLSVSFPGQPSPQHRLWLATRIYLEEPPSASPPTQMLLIPPAEGPP